MKTQIVTASFLALSSQVAADNRVPFFDNDPSTAYAPAYTFEYKPIDKDVLEICGDWGYVVTSNDLKSFFNKHPDLTERLLSIDNSLTQKKLVRLWAENDGFTHIFCGEREKNGTLGGLHYAPRYKALFDQNHISMCKLGTTNCFDPSKNEIVEDKGIYSIPVSYIKPDGREGLKPVNGYNLEMNADEILYEATRGYFKLNGRKGCFLNIPETNDYPAHTAVIVSTRNNAITTFYSVGPNGRKYNARRYNTKDCE
ncbi:hypothetical protein C9J01_11125 [Photobacterium rosenbergii]|uniref:Bacterial EndoU nuclease domain-containing protein n=1 Tax=Photobacterium rosenbergii TaxID=294936 RepID=A0A2T3NFP6_9GAMM|nr:EndoU domain-containing protein [Photobacterium rosenbergii]PSW13387.1 hypothetical protein C9J01_11125 [Photobacterium rosenbergii]